MRGCPAGTETAQAIIVWLSLLKLFATNCRRSVLTAKERMTNVSLLRLGNYSRETRPLVEDILFANPTTLSR